MKKLVLLAFTFMFGIAVMACTGETTTAAPTTAAPTTAAPTTAAPTTVAPTTVAPTTTAAPTTTTAAPILVQGVTPTSVKVGNAASTTGAAAAIGVPFNAGITAYFEYINGQGGVGGRTIQFVTYDDQTSPTTGLAHTQTLIETDEIFALVGHFGTWTVGATLGLIEEVGIPMVYAATGINSLYFQESVGNPVMAVQPIYKTDGRIMTARAVNEQIYGTNKDEALPAGAKIGVIYTNDDVGLSIKAGIDQEAEILGRTADMVYQAVTGYSFVTAVAILKASGVSVVILAMNQEPFGYALTQMSNQSLNVPVFSSYVNADVTVVDHYRYNENRPIYVNAWLDIVDPEGLYGFSADYWAFVAVMTAAGYDGLTVGKANYTANAFAMAGYIAAAIFVEGLNRVEEAEEDLTWANYIAAMESEPLDLPMGGLVDWTGGKRWGIASMALLKYGFTDNEGVITEAFTKVQNIQTIEEIEGLDE